MNTLGWIFILAGILLARSVSKGRVMNIGEDLSDGFLAFAQGDQDKLKEVFSRTGDANQVTEPVMHDIRHVSVEEIQANPGIAQSAINLGKRAKGYKFGATGPDYYDCSGLVWRALQEHGYKGGRFTTSNMRGLSVFKQIDKKDAGVNDIVLWPGYEGLIGHTGVMTTPTDFYSARSVRSGIGYAKIQGFKSTSPIYLRYVGTGGK